MNGQRLLINGPQNLKVLKIDIFDLLSECGVTDSKSRIKQMMRSGAVKKLVPEFGNYLIKDDEQYIVPDTILVYGKKAWRII